MQRYIIIDTRAFDCQCILLEHQNGHLVVLENRQYLPPLTSDSWRDKLPKALKQICKNQPNTEFVFLLPDSAVMNLTLEVFERPNISIRENISHILYKNFKISPTKYCFQFSHLDGNRYMVLLALRRFIHFVKEAIDDSFGPIKILPFFIGQFAYIKTQASDQNVITIFIEKQLRRFFINTPQETNFIDFYQSNTDDACNFSDIRNTQQFIFQTLNIPEGEKRLILIGDISDTLKELYANEYGASPEQQENTKHLLGCTEKISEIAKCVYGGIDSIFNGKFYDLLSFDFYKIPTHNYSNWLKQHPKLFAIIACIFFIFSSIFFAKELHQYLQLKGKYTQLQHCEDNIERLHSLHDYWDDREQKSTLLPKILLKYCYLLQTIPGKFCIDHLGFEHINDQDFCSIRGRIYQENLESFKKFLKERLPQKLDFYSEPSDENIDNFSLQILLDPLPALS